MKKVLIFFTVIFGAIILVAKTNTSLAYRINSFLSPDPTILCKKKRIIWDTKGTYEIDSTGLQKQLVLRVENRNEDKWSKLLKPISGKEAAYKRNSDTCTANVTKFPSFVEDGANVPYEVRKQSSGLIISVGTKDGTIDSLYHPIAMLTLNMQLFANRYTNEDYNLDEALRYIAGHYKLIRGPNGALRLSYTGGLGGNSDSKAKFEFDFIQFDGKYLTTKTEQNNAVEFVSQDNGETWQAVPVKKTSVSYI